MIRAIRLLIALVGCWGGVAHAAPTASYVSIFGAAGNPAFRADGSLPAFRCLAPSPSPAARPRECFGFEPDLPSANTVRFDSGGSLVRTGTGPAWTEAPGGFHFIQQPDLKGRLVLLDASRNIRWIISGPSGPSTLEVNGVAHPFYRVTAVDYPTAPLGRVTSRMQTAGGLPDPLSPPADNGPVYSRQIDTRLRVDIHSVISNWNRTSHRLTSESCLELIEALAATIGVEHRPTAHAADTADYVRALAALNRPAAKP